MIEGVFQGLVEGQNLRGGARLRGRLCLGTRRCGKNSHHGDRGTTTSNHRRSLRGGSMCSNISPNNSLTRARAVTRTFRPAGMAR